MDGVAVRGQTRAWPRTDALARLVPSGRSLAAGFALVALAAGGYAAARTTSAFAVTAVEVRGAPPALASRVRTALRPLLGKSLLDVRGREVEQRVEAIPAVAAATHDRAFPHTLVVSVTPERPIGVLRRGPQSWLISARGRVLEPLARGARPRLARLWLSQAVDVTVGERVDDASLRRSLRVLLPLQRDGFPVLVRTVRADGELTVALAPGLDLKLGDETDLDLKLAVARRVVPALLAGGDDVPSYLDVSVPERPVAPANSQLSS